MKIIFTIIFLPIIEIYLFVKIGTEIGPTSTIIFTLLTAILGVATIRYQGLASFVQARQSMLNANHLGIEILSNLMLFISGIFLLIPGFFTDFIGILILLPPTRIILVNLLIKKAYSGLKSRTHHASKNKDYIDIDPDN